MENAFYVLGGFTGYSDHLTIGRLDSSYFWSNVGQLMVNRYGHGAIGIGSDIIVAGGRGHKTEVCSIAYGKVTCTAPNNVALTNYQYYPELFLVPKNFCKTCP